MPSKALVTMPLTVVTTLRLDTRLGTKVSSILLLNSLSSILLLSSVDRGLIVGRYIGVVG